MHGLNCSTRALHSARRAGILAAMLGLAACSDPLSPADDGGDPPPPEPTYTATINLRSVTAMSICEEAFTDFDGGEFIWKIAVTWPDGTVNTLNQTASYPSAAGWQKLTQGQAKAVSASAVKAITGRTGAIRFSVRASEVDFDLFGGNPGRDGRMNDRSAEGVHTASAVAWPQGTFTVTVAPEAACRFQARYDLTVTSN